VDKASKIFKKNHDIKEIYKVYSFNILKTPAKHRNINPSNPKFRQVFETE
jgi:hypothetical protein